MFQFGAASERELADVHPDLVAVDRRALELTPVDFGIHDGLRSLDEQREYFAAGVSMTMESRHLLQADGYAHATDNVPYIAGKLRWEWPPIYQVIAAVRQASIELQVPIVWGGVWDRLLADLNPKNLHRERLGYIKRCRRLRRSEFTDGPHIELASSYRGRQVAAAA